jgi:opacity protein-like surface antigen
MKKLMVLTLAAALLAPALARADTFTLRLGYYMPKTSTNPNTVWGIEFDNMNFAKEDFRGGIYGGGYEYFINSYVSLALTLDSYSRDRIGSYRDYEGITVDTEDYAFSTSDIAGDFYINHVFKVAATPLQLSLKLTPLGRRVRVIPYVGGGVSLVFYRVSIRGETIDFTQPTEFLDAEDNTIIGYPITVGETRETGSAWGGHAFGGVMIPLGYRITLEAEARYHFARANLHKQFLDFDPFDLGGLALMLGFNFWF